MSNLNNAQVFDNQIQDQPANETTVPDSELKPISEIFSFPTSVPQRAHSPLLKYGKIDKDGTLWIQRGSEVKEMYCKYTDNGCDDQCPAFGEPFAGILDLCDNLTLYFEKFEDERPQEED